MIINAGFNPRNLTGVKLNCKYIADKHKQDDFAYFYLKQERDDIII